MARGLKRSGVLTLCRQGALQRETSLNKYYLSSLPFFFCVLFNKLSLPPPTHTQTHAKKEKSKMAKDLSADAV